MRSPKKRKRHPVHVVRTYQLVRCELPQEAEKILTGEYASADGGYLTWTKQQSRRV